jgi:very-short-patch-repair endonuclease
MLKGSGKAYRRARELRRNLSLPEILLWRELSRGRTGDHWRKQHPAGPYNLDFYCDRAKLCVEVDGEAHDRGNRPQRDERRDRWLSQRGVLSLRFAAVDVLRNLEAVLASIQDHARERAPLHRPADGPPPPAAPGEDL